MGTAVVEDHVAAQLRSLKAGLLTAALLALLSLVSLAFTRELPHQPPPRSTQDPQLSSA